MSEADIDPMLRQWMSPNVREQSASVIQVENGRGLIAVACILAAGAVLSMGIAFHAVGRADMALEEAKLMERETRLMKDDLKYIRAYLSARGIHIPQDHDEAEENQLGSQNNHQQRDQSATSRSGSQAGAVNSKAGSR